MRLTPVHTRSADTREPPPIPTSPTDWLYEDEEDTALQGHSSNNTLGVDEKQSALCKHMFGTCVAMDNKTITLAIPMSLEREEELDIAEAPGEIPFKTTPVT
ncbi:Bleomycin hydrolase [Venturia inaequalis]|nr:Bleomycin hydrolase [Venturia inaequalis]